MNPKVSEFLKHRSKIIFSKGLIKFFGNNFLWRNDNQNLINMRHNQETSVKTKYIKTKTNIDPEKSIIVRSKQDAKLRGSTIHKEIEDFVQFGPEIFSLTHPNPDPLTAKIAQSLKGMGFVGIFAEYPIWFRIPRPHPMSDPVFFSDIFDGNTFLASSVDLICYDTKKSKIVLIEIKTGYNNSLFFDQFVSDKELNILKSQKYTQNNTNNSGVNLPDSFLGKEQFENPYSSFSNSNLSSSNISYNKKFTSESDSLDVKMVGYMLAGLSGMKDCPINRAKIQLCSYMYFFREIIKEDCDGYVLHCQTNGTINFYDINEPYYKKYSQILKNEFSKIGVL